MDLGWISLISEDMIIFCKIGLLLTSLSRDSLSSLLVFLASYCYDMFVSSIIEFIPSLLLISLYMK